MLISFDPNHKIRFRLTDLILTAFAVRLPGPPDYIGSLRNPGSALRPCHLRSC